MASLDTTILNTAVPTIAHALKVHPLSMKAVLASASTIASTVQQLAVSAAIMI